VENEPSSTSLLQLEVQRDVGSTVVAVAGEVDMLSSERMREAMFAELRSRPDLLVVDLADVEFFPSSGISALALLDRAARDAGVTLRVVANARSVLRPLQITELYADQNVLASRAEALAASSSPDV
jgi:anti-sigma B factor antagonist